MRVIALLALCCAAVAAVPAEPQRIIGGSTTTIQSYPQIAALLYSGDLSTYWQSCGGTIINSRSVLTAAHCTIGDAANRWRVRVGSTWANSGGVVHSLSQIINHPSYFVNVVPNNDVAIVRLASFISFNQFVQPAALAGAYYYLNDNQAVWAAGWGVTSVDGSPSEELRHVQVWTVNQNECRQRYSSVGWPIADGMLCSGWLGVGGRDQCQGDSGGPLLHNRVVVGVCSFGLECARPDFPGVNARVSSYIAWIRSNA